MPRGENGPKERLIIWEKGKVEEKVEVRVETIPARRAIHQEKDAVTLLRASDS